MIGQTEPWRKRRSRVARRSSGGSVGSLKCITAKRRLRKADDCTCRMLALLPPAVFPDQSCRPIVPEPFGKARALGKPHLESKNVDSCIATLERQLLTSNLTLSASPFPTHHIMQPTASRLATGHHGVHPWRNRPNPNPYKSPFAPKYTVPTHIYGVDARYAMKL